MWELAEGRLSPRLDLRFNPHLALGLPVRCTPSVFETPTGICVKMPCVAADLDDFFLEELGGRMV